ncbi:MAG: 4a-hydroxytetrahydrobiopterin dehydratase [Planctomycetaceae bacterium]
MADDVVLTKGELEAELLGLEGWEVREGWLRRKFVTPGWPHTLMLVNAIGLVAEAAWHHPDLEVGYAQVVVKIQTHRVRAITWSDVELARRIEEVAIWQPNEDAALSGYPKQWIR